MDISQDSNSLPQVELRPVTLDPSRLSVCSVSTQSTSLISNSEIPSPNGSNEKKKRTVTFAEIDISELDYHATKIPADKKREWKKQAIRRKLEKKEYNRRLKMVILKGCIVFIFFALCSLIVLLATAQGTHMKL